jgi:polysaccharide export outer membrane protein
VKIKLLKKLILVIFAAASLSSCITLNPGRMLKTPKDYQFAKFPDSVKIEPYRIAVNDVVRFSLYTNDGFKLASILGNQEIGIQGNSAVQNFIEFKVRPDGNIKMPVLGEVNVLGLTVKETEEMLETKFQQFFVNPFVIVEITNKRIFMFKGGSFANEVTLENENSTLFEVLAKSGGVAGSTGALGGNNMANNGQNYASKIKIIRGDLKNPTIYLVDLSKIDGLKDADIIMQAGDIVYIDPVINYGYSISQDIGSVTGLVSSVLSIFLIYNLITKK